MRARVETLKAADRTSVPAAGWVEAMAIAARRPRSVLRQFISLAAAEQYAIEEDSKLILGVKREDMRNILIGAHNHDAALVAIDAANRENIPAIPEIRTEHLFVVA